MKKIAVIILTLVLLLGTVFCVPVSASENDAMFIYCEYEGDDQSYCIEKYIGEAGGTVEIPAEFNGKPIVAINHEAFQGNKTVTEVVIPSSVIHIRTSAFKNCTALKKISGAENVVYIDTAAFSGCSKLSTVAFSPKIEYIGGLAFSNCAALKEITLPDGIDTIYYNTFDGTGIYKNTANWSGKLFYIGSYLLTADSSIKGKVTVKDSTKYMAWGALQSKSKITSVVLPDSLKVIGDRAFYNCDGLTSITVPKKVTLIGREAFSSCKVLKTVKLGSYVKTIESQAFAYNEVLTSVAFNSRLKTIEDNAFTGCLKLKEIKLKDNVSIIGEKAFANCKALSAITLPDSVQKIGEDAFKGTKYYNTDKNWLSGVLYIGKNLIKADKEIKTNYPIKSGTLNIADGAFKSCATLKSVVIPKTVRQISADAFNGCKKLAFVYIPEGVTKICAGAFMNCSNLKLTSIPSTVVAIEQNAFTALEAINVPETVTTLKAGAINKTAVIYGKTGSAAEAFAKKNGNEFKDVSEHKHTITRVEYSAQGYSNPGITYRKCDVCNKITAFSVKAQKKPAEVKLSKIANRTYGVELVWKKVSGADSYKIYRKANGAKSWSYVTTVVEGNTYVDYNAKNNTKYTYTVKAQNEAGSGSHNTKGLTTKFVSAPELINLENTDAGLKVSWKKVSGADYYYIYRVNASEGNTWVRIAKVSGSVTSYVDKSAKYGNDYAYKLKAFNGSYKSDYSELGNFHTFRLKTPSLSSAVSTKSGVKITWGKVSYADGYVVLRKTGSGSWEELAVVSGGDKVSYVDKTAKKGVTYTYTVKASKYGYYTSAYNKTGLKVKDIY